LCRYATYAYTHDWTMRKEQAEQFRNALLAARTGLSGAAAAAATGAGGGSSESGGGGGGELGRSSGARNSWGGGSIEGDGAFPSPAGGDSGDGVSGGSGANTPGDASPPERVSSPGLKRQGSLSRQSGGGGNMAGDYTSRIQFTHSYETAWSHSTLCFVLLNYKYFLLPPLDRMR
jgi:hypothetical protein